MMTQRSLGRYLRTATTTRSFSNIVRSPFSCPELHSDLIKMSVPQFTMAKFLNSDVKDRVAYVDGSTGASWTYQEMHTKTHKFAHCLLDMGLSKGDCVGIMSPNHIHFFTSFQGLGLIGAISSPIVSPPLFALSLSHTHGRILSTPRLRSSTSCVPPIQRS
jgi:hypothetical protein